MLSPSSSFNRVPFSLFCSFARSFAVVQRQTHELLTWFLRIIEPQFRQFEISTRSLTLTTREIHFYRRLIFILVAARYSSLIDNDPLLFQLLWNKVKITGTAISGQIDRVKSGSARWKGGKIREKLGERNFDRLCGFTIRRHHFTDSSTILLLTGSWFASDGRVTRCSIPRGYFFVIASAGIRRRQRAGHSSFFIHAWNNFRVDINGMLFIHHFLLGSFLFSFFNEISIVQFDLISFLRLSRERNVEIGFFFSLLKCNCLIVSNLFSLSARNTPIFLVQRSNARISFPFCSFKTCNRVVIIANTKRY